MVKPVVQFRGDLPINIVWVLRNKWHTKFLVCFVRFYIISNRVFMMKINDVEVILLQSKAHLKDTFLEWRGGFPFDLVKMVDPLNFYSTQHPLLLSLQ